MRPAAAPALSWNRQSSAALTLVSQRSSTFFVEVSHCSVRNGAGSEGKAGQPGPGACPGRMPGAVWHRWGTRSGGKKAGFGVWWLAGSPRRRRARPRGGAFVVEVERAAECFAESGT